MANEGADGSLSFKASISVEADKLLRSFQNIKRIAVSAFKDMQTAATRAYTQMDRDLQRSRNAVGELQEKLEQQAKLLERLRSGAAGKSKASTGREAVKLAEKEYNNLVEQLKRAEQEMQAYGQQIHNVENQHQTSIANSTKKLDSMIQKYRELLIRKNELDQQGYTTGDSSYDRTVSQLARLGDAIDRYKNKLLHTKEDSKSAANNTNIFVRALVGLKSALSGIGSAFKRAFSTANTKLISAAKSATSSLASNLKSKLTPSFKGSEKTLKKLTRTLIKYIFGVRSFFFLYRRIRKAVGEGLGSLALVDDRTNQSISDFKTALNSLRGALAGAFAPIVNVVAPILTMFCNMLSTAINYIGMFIAYLTGQKTYYKAVSVQQDYAASLQDTADAANAADKATKDYLSGLDEIRKWEDPNANAGGSGGGGGGGADPTQGLIWEEVEIPDSIKNLADTLKGYFENQDWEGLGEFLAEKVNGVFEKLYEIINWENVGPKVTPVIEGITGTFNSLVDNIDWDLIGRTFGAGINTVVNSLDLLLTGVDWKNLGSKVSEGVLGLIKEIDWDKVGTTIADSFNTIIDSANGFITTFTQNGGWQQAGQSIADTINGLVNNIHWDTLGQDIGEGIKGILTTLTTAIQNVDWVQLGEDVKTALINIDWVGIFEALFEFIGSAIGGIGAFLIGLFKDAIDALADWWNTNAFDEDGKFTAEGLLNAIGDVFKNIGKWIKEHIFQPFINGFKSVFGINSPATAPDLVDAASNVGEGILQSIANVFKNIGSWVKEHILDPIANAIGKVIEIGVSLVQEGWTTVSGWLKSFGDWTKEKISQGVELVKEGWTKVSDWVSEKKENFGEAVKKGVELVKEGWTKVQEWAEKPENSGSLVAKGVNLIKSGWETAKEWVEEAKQSGGIVEKGVNLIKSGWSKFTSWITGNDEGVAEIPIRITADKSGIESPTDISDLTGEGAVNEKFATIKVKAEWAEKEKNINEWVQNYGGGSDVVEEKLALKWQEKKAKSINEWVQQYGDGSDTIEEKIALKKGEELTKYKGPKWWAKSLDGKQSVVTEGVQLKRDGNLAANKSPKAYAKSFDNKKSTVTEGVDVYKSGNLKDYGNAAAYAKQGIGTITISVDANIPEMTQAKLANQAEQAVKRGMNAPITAATGAILPFVGGGILRSMGQILAGVPHYASGTTRPHGTMFIAGEAGPEIIGHINGQTEILNKSQIAAAIYSAVTTGIGAVLSRFASLLFAHMNYNATNLINALTNHSILAGTTIPNIATGSVLPANKAFLASTNTSVGGMSETDLRQLIREETSRSNARYEFVAQLNRKTIFDEIIQEARMRQIQTGRNPFEFA